MIQTESPIFGLMVSSFRDKKFSNRARGKGLAIATRITPTPTGERNVPGSGQFICWKAVRGGEQRHEVAIRPANSSFPDRLKPGKGRKYAWHEGGKRKIHCPQFVCSGLIRYRVKQTFDYTNEMLVVMIGRFLANSHYRCSIISWFNEISGWNCAPPW